MSDKDKKRILVIKLSALGDFVQSLGPMAAIRRFHPNDEITLLTTKPYAGLAEKAGYFDNIWIDERLRWSQPLNWLAFAKKLNGGGFSRVYDLQNNDRTGLYFKLFKNKPEWVGIAKGASHRNVSPERTAGRAFEGHKQTLALAGIGDVTVDNLSWIEADLSSFGLKKPYILLVPGCAPQHMQKRWAPQNYGKVATIITARGFQPVVLGTAAEKAEATIIKETCPATLDLTGKTALLDLPALARDASGAIGNDTGPMHFIGPTGCPSLVLFSSASNPTHHAPLGAHVQTIQREKLDDLSVDEVMKIFDELTT